MNFASDIIRMEVKKIRDLQQQDQRSALDGEDEKSYKTGNSTEKKAAGSGAAAPSASSPSVQALRAETNKASKATSSSNGNGNKNKKEDDGDGDNNSKSMSELKSALLLKALYNLEEKFQMPNEAEGGQEERI